jgi:hypothetical protein
MTPGPCGTAAAPAVGVHRAGVTGTGPATPDVMWTGALVQQKPTWAIRVAHTPPLKNC